MGITESTHVYIYYASQKPKKRKETAKKGTDDRVMASKARARDERSEEDVKDRQRDPDCKLQYTSVSWQDVDLTHLLFF